MSPDKDAKLRADYPHVFQKPLLNNDPICCRDGWYPLLDDLCRTLNRIIGFMPEAERPMYAAVQVKEKFGTLRFYLRGHAHDSAAEQWIRRAEQASATVCDVCGKDGTMRGGKDGDMWLRVRCDEHEDTRESP
jgi:hypothetical protein